MTVGIYALYWEEQDLIYIGQSQNIERRFKEHIRDLNSSSHSNYKVQNCFNSYGAPSTLIIEVTNLESLNDKEIYWTKEFDSINNGLNIIEAGLVGYGVNSNASKYSKLQVLKVFRLLYNTSFTYEKITKSIRVNKSLVQDISNGNSHIWLKNKYPYLYSRMFIKRDYKTHDLNRSTIQDYYTLIQLKSPSNEIFTLSTSIHSFCSQIPSLCIDIKSSARGIARIIDGTRKQYKGWYCISNTKFQTASGR